MEAVLRKPRLLRALTSLDAGEFARLLAAFEQASRARRGRFNRFGQERRRAPGATGNAGVLSTPKARLFFVLFYFKCYPLQEVMGVLFGLSQPQACLWIGRLTPLVNAALGREADACGKQRPSLCSSTYHRGPTMPISDKVYRNDEAKSVSQRQRCS